MGIQSCRRIVPLSPSLRRISLPGFRRGPVIRMPRVASNGNVIVRYYYMQCSGTRLKSVRRRNTAILIKRVDSAPCLRWNRLMFDELFEVRGALLLIISSLVINNLTVLLRHFVMVFKHRRVDRFYRKNRPLFESQFSRMHLIMCFLF